MSTEVPATPHFEDELARVLRARATVKRRRVPARLTALRSLWSLNRMGLHAALACGLAATLLLMSPDVASRDLPLTADPAAAPTPAYLYQYGGPNIEDTIAAARDRGFEVQVLRSYVTDSADHQRILSIRHAGSDLDDLPDAGARGPLLIVMGLAIGDQFNTAD